LFRKVADLRRTKIIGIAAFAAVMIPGMVNTCSALEVRLGAQSMVTSSDNIERATVGLETKGYLITIDGEFGVSGKVGSGTVDLLVGGGEEKIKAEEISRADNYRSRFEVRFPWTTTGHVQVLATSFQGTEDPQITDIDQSRVRTRRSGAALELRRRTSPKFRWDAAVNAEIEKRVDREDTREVTGDVALDLALTRTHSLVLEAGGNRGREDIAGDEWTGTNGAVDFTKQVDPLTSAGWRLEWEGSRVERSDGTEEPSDRVSALVHYAVKMSSGWSFRGELGGDGIKPVADERRWEPKATLGLFSSPERRVRFEGSVSTSSSLQDPVERQIAWTRDSRLRAQLVWAASRTYTVKPGVEYLAADLHGSGIDDRKDDTTILRMETVWQASRNWSVSLNAQAEERTSSQASFELSEDRLELSLSGALF